MKASTLREHRRLANDALYRIYRHIDSDLNLDLLAKDLGVSRHHLQRLFLEQTGSNLYETIRSIRLQKAASLLLSNRHATVSEIAGLCGYGSQTSFIRAFSARYGMTPGEWRRGGYRRYVRENLGRLPREEELRRRFGDLEPRLVRAAPMPARYIRHRGYDPRRLRRIWQRLWAWLQSHGIERYRLVGLYHDNPLITPLEECSYIAAAVTEERPPRGEALPEFEIPGGLYAVFTLEGRTGEMLELMQWIYHIWLPDSGYETTPMPAYSLFERHHLLHEDQESFLVHYHLPVRVV